MVQGPSMVDRLDGVNEGIGVKAPCRLKTTANHALSGLAAIDGVTPVEDDRILVGSNTDAKTNGIYDASSGVWSRSLDFNGNRDIVDGSRVRVTAGTVGDGTEWAVVATNPVIIDTSEIAWEQVTGGGGGNFIQAPYWTVGNVTDLTLERAGTAGTGITITDGGANSTITVAVTANVRSSGVLYEIDGQGSVITTGIKALGIRMPFNGTITGVYLYADQSGSIVIDVWKDTHANYAPTVADSICASAKPTISSATKSSDTTLTGWTTTFSAGDLLRLNVDSVSTVTKVDFNLGLLKT